ncbi:MAG: hypothetical protein PF495_10675 [Spirochaetales bacterium]|jgi:hypothetical protein|nr:hypothetical protein [Spirochaetales bacterium]
MVKASACWTKNNLNEHRERMGWPPLENNILKGVLRILNDTDEEMRAISNVSWIEPDMHFILSKKREGDVNE